MEDSTFTRHEIDKQEQQIITQIISNSSKVAERSESKDTPLPNMIEIGEGETTVKKRSYREKLRVIETEYNDKRPLYVIALRPFLALGLPAFLWGGFVYGVQVMWLSLIATTQSEFFSVEPYNFGAAAVGDTNFASLIGTAIGSFWGGNLSDRFVAHMSRKNNGVFEPEFRLWFVLLPAVINSAGLLMYGLGLNSGTHWILPGGFGMAFLGFGMGSAGAITITYALDCYPNMQSEGLVLMLFLRNMIGMGFTFAIQPWLDTDGLVTTTWLMFMLSIVFNFSSLIMIKWGKQLRRSTKSFYLKYSNKDILFK
ncbi:unnamed protein product [Ambrosiozyma monospora]|uniref:Unnamed protein product n=1 Tax=Ambrosiozyma monospora TaxID=43982 RepID=A0ACB5TF83_AMBMO|nr:unnamed protein product [Ambrosiozyma monospora]